MALLALDVVASVWNSSHMKTVIYLGRALAFPAGGCTTLLVLVALGFISAQNDLVERGRSRRVFPNVIGRLVAFSIQQPHLRSGY